MCESTILEGAHVSPLRTSSDAGADGVVSIPANSAQRGSFARCATAGSVVLSMLAVFACSEQETERLADVGAVLNTGARYSASGPAFTVTPYTTLTDPDIAAAVRRLQTAVVVSQRMPVPLEAATSGLMIRAGAVDPAGNAAVVLGDSVVHVPSGGTPAVIDFGMRTPIQPNGIVALAEGDWLVTDRTAAAKILSVSSDGHRVTGTLPLLVPAESSCTIGNRVFVRGWNHADGLTVHAYGVDGRLAWAFAPGYASGSSFVRGQLSKGLVGCLQASEPVVTAEFAFPYVRGFSTAGSLLWTSELADMRVPTYTLGRSDRGTEAVRRKRGPVHDVAVNIVELSSDVMLFQYYRIRRATADDEPVVEVRSVLMKSSNGAGVYFPQELPFIIAANSKRAIGIRPPESAGAHELALVRMLFQP